MQAKPKAVVLLSGGLDSTTTLAIAKNQGFEPYALTFRYGQRHAFEIEAARHVATSFGVAQHVIAEIDLRLFGGSALTIDIAVPKGRAIADMTHGTQSPMYRRATRSFSRLRSHGRRCSEPTASLWESMHSITVAILIADPSSLRHTSAWPIWRRKPE